MVRISHMKVKIIEAAATYPGLALSSCLQSTNRPTGSKHPLLVPLTGLSVACRADLLRELSSHAVDDIDKIVFAQASVSSKK